MKRQTQSRLKARGPQLPDRYQRGRSISKATSTYGAPLHRTRPGIRQCRRISRQGLLPRISVPRFLRCIRCQPLRSGSRMQLDSFQGRTGLSQRLGIFVQLERALASLVEWTRRRMLFRVGSSRSHRPEAYLHCKSTDVHTYIYLHQWLKRK